MSACITCFHDFYTIKSLSVIKGLSGLSGWGGQLRAWPAANSNPCSFISCCYSISTHTLAPTVVFAQWESDLCNHWGSMKFYCKCCDGGERERGGGRRKRRLNVLHPLWQETWALPSQVNILENERVIMSGNICTSHSNYCTQSLMTHRHNITFLIWRKRRAKTAKRAEKQRPELSNYVSCSLR